MKGGRAVDARTQLAACRTILEGAGNLGAQPAQAQLSGPLTPASLAALKVLGRALGMRPPATLDCQATDAEIVAPAGK